MREPCFAHDYEPHRWGSDPAFPPMDEAREQQALEELRAMARKRTVRVKQEPEPLPERFCEHCAGKIEPRLRGRTRHPYTLEQFMRRRYCSQRCYRAHKSGNHWFRKAEEERREAA